MDPHNPIIIERNLMLDRLPNYRAPRMSGCILGLLLCSIVMLCALIVFLDHQVTAQAAPAERVQPALAHPLGCPIEDVRGRPLQATLSIQGEKKPRCYYGKKPL